MTVAIENVEASLLVTGWSGGLELGPESLVLLEGAGLHQGLHWSQDFSAFVSFTIWDQERRYRD